MFERDRFWMMVGAAALAGCATTGPARVEAPVGSPPPAGAIMMAFGGGQVRWFDASGQQLKAMPIDFELNVAISDPQRGRVVGLAGDQVVQVALGGEPAPVVLTSVAPTNNTCLDGMTAGQAVQDPTRDIGLSADGAALCLRLQDRNINMADTIVVARVALDGGAQEAVTTLNVGECAPSESDQVPCDDFGVLAHDDEVEVVVDPEACTVVVGQRTLDMTHFNLSDGCPEFERGRSASGRYITLGVVTEDSTDYIYQRVMTFDLETGTHVAALDRQMATEQPVLWSPTADAVLLGEELAVPSTGTIVEVGPSAVWIK